MWEEKKIFFIHIPWPGNISSSPNSTPLRKLETFSIFNLTVFWFLLRNKSTSVGNFPVICGYKLSLPGFDDEKTVLTFAVLLLHEKMLLAYVCTTMESTWFGYAIIFFYE